MKRYNFELKLFVLDSRRQGKRWGEIKRAIKEKFKIEPPTVRTMQNWQEGTDRDILSRALKDKAEEESEVIRKQAVNRVVQEMLPQILEAKAAGTDIEYIGWRWFFSVMSNILGRDKFRQFMDRYIKENSE